MNNEKCLQKKWRISDDSVLRSPVDYKTLQSKKGCTSNRSTVLPYCNGVWVYNEKYLQKIVKSSDDSELRNPVDQKTFHEKIRSIPLIVARVYVYNEKYLQKIE